ncbi:hypothetical protein [Actinomycetospora sp.]|uniref:hypothetical protein n=1 Tax=Actinomycetospora sp. TaxID=1872135 RepID=UPI002F4293EB
MRTGTPAVQRPGAPTEQAEGPAEGGRETGSSRLGSSEASAPGATQEKSRGTSGPVAGAVAAGAGAAAAASAAPAAVPAEKKPGPSSTSAEPDAARNGQRERAKTESPRPAPGPAVASAPPAAQKSAPPAAEKKSGRYTTVAAGAAVAGAGAAVAASAAPAVAPKEKPAGPSQAGSTTTGSTTTGSATTGSATTTTGSATTDTGTDTATVAEPAAAERTDAMVPVVDPDAGPETPPRPGALRDRRRRRRVLFAFVLAALILAAFLGLVALVSDHGSSNPPRSAPPEPAVSVPLAPPPPPPQLPRGGTTIFPNYRVVAYYGTADTDRLGVLGAGTPEEAATKLEQAATPFASPGRTVQPAMELIVGVADGSPGPDGDYHHDIDENAVRQYLATARAHRELMIIDIQPGRTDFMTAVRPWENLLREPDVSLALDPEWRMPPGAVPGKQIGTVSADEINQVSAWLAGVVTAGNLPQKLFVVHQFTSNMITNPERLQTPPQLAVVQHIDGFGAPPNKLGKYKDLQRPQQLHLGFKLFYTQDTPMLTPQQALALAPAPDLVTYQ